MRNKKAVPKQTGQALISLLFFAIIAIVVATASTTVIFINSQSNTKLELGNLALTISESGAENALLRIVRDPSYSGETMSVGDGTATITVSGDSEKTIISIGNIKSVEKKIEVKTSFSGGILQVNSWKNIY